MTTTNIIPITELRERKCQQVEKRGGVYCWWFKKDAALNLLQSLDLTTCEQKKILKRNIQGEEYWCLYFGISTNLRMRARWHIIQKHTISAVTHGTLSTLRQTICALCHVEMIEGEACVNKVMDENCFWEWCHCDNSKAIEIEKSKLTSQEHCFPLNIQNNKTVRSDVVNNLKKLRKQSR